MPAKKQRDSGRLEYTTPSNLVVMRKELYELFDDNAFSIDVDVRLQAQCSVCSWAF